MNAPHVKRWILATLLLTVFTVGCTKAPAVRTDQQVAAEVQVKLNADASVPTKGLVVTAANGIVTLAGTVTSESERLTAANDAAQIEGVKTVVNNLTVAEAALPVVAAPAPTRRAAPVRRALAPVASAPVNTTPHNVAGDVISQPVAMTPAPPPPIPTITVPAGTEITIRTIDAINSETANVGDNFTGTIDQAVYVGDTIVIPTGADVQGRVVDVKSAGRYAGQSTLVLKLTRMSFNGKTYPIDTNRWTKSGSSRGKNTAAKVGGGAALGAIIGGIAGGGKGAAIGATVGAGAGAGVQTVTKGQQIDLRSESSLTFNLQSPVTVVPSSSNRRGGRVMSDNQ